ncbi:hypothetical protein ACS0TY_011641 [Phlomoides rotata]
MVKSVHWRTIRSDLTRLGQVRSEPMVKSVHWRTIRSDLTRLGQVRSGLTPSQNQFIRRPFDQT